MYTCFMYIPSSRLRGRASGPPEGPTDGPAGGPTEGPTDGPAGGPAEGPTEGPTSGPTEGPTDGPAGGPTEGPTSGPAEGPTEGPTEGPAFAAACVITRLFMCHRHSTQCTCTVRACAHVLCTMLWPSVPFVTRAPMFCEQDVYIRGRETTHQIRFLIQKCTRKGI